MSSGVALTISVGNVDRCRSSSRGRGTEQTCTVLVVEPSGQIAKGEVVAVGRDSVQVVGSTSLAATEIDDVTASRLEGHVLALGGTIRAASWTATRKDDRRQERE